MKKFYNLGAKVYNLPFYPNSISFFYDLLITSTNIHVFHQLFKKSKKPIHAQRLGAVMSEHSLFPKTDYGQAQTSLGIIALLDIKSKNDFYTYATSTHKRLHLQYKLDPQHCSSLNPCSLVPVIIIRTPCEVCNLSANFYDLPGMLLLFLNNMKLFQNSTYNR